MMRHSYLLILSLLFFPCFLFAQQKDLNVDFSRVDSVAMTAKYDGNIYQLTKQLTNPYTDDLLKVRAIFRWITDNIAYDYKFYNRYDYKGKDPKGFECNGDSIDCDTKLKVYENEYVNKVLDNKKAVCQGYAMLFKKMCEIAGIAAEVLPGYVRTEYYQIGYMGELNHAWNAVLINGTYHLLDATWAAGGCLSDEDGKLLLFIKSYKDYYWLTPPEEFAKNHYPETDKWVLIPKYTKDNFSANPYYAPNVLSNIKLIAPASGIIKAKKGDTIHFKLVYTGQVRELQINSNVFQNPDIWTEEYITKRKFRRIPDTLAIKKQQYIKFRQQGNAYEFTYVVKDNSLDYLDIMFDRYRVMRFKVRANR